jgi:hypothetical protein
VLLGSLVYSIVVWSNAGDWAPLILGASFGLFVLVARWIQIRYPDIERGGYQAATRGLPPSPRTRSAESVGMAAEQGVKRRVILVSSAGVLLILALNAVGTYLLINDSYIGSFVCASSILVGFGIRAWQRRQPPPYGSV